MFSPQVRFSLRDPDDPPGRINVHYILYSSTADALYRLSELTKDEELEQWVIDELGKLWLARVQRRKVNGVRMRVGRTEREKMGHLRGDLDNSIRGLENKNKVEDD